MQIIVINFLQFTLLPHPIVYARIEDIVLNVALQRSIKADGCQTHLTEKSAP